MSQPIQTARVGDLEIVYLPDARGSFGTYDELFGNVPEGAWERSRADLPEHFDGDNWITPFGSYVIRSEGMTVAIDTGLGPAPGEPDFMPERQGWLPRSLELAGVDAEEVDVVFSTHHHTDHIGWNAIDGVPMFPRARYLTGREAWTWTLVNRKEDYVLAQVTPLADAGVVDLVEDGDEVAPGLTALSTPGHYPGHMSVQVASAGERAIVLGDVTLHPAQITYPEITYAFDADPALATQTRTTLLAELHGFDGLVCCSHFARGGLGRLDQRGERPVWVPVA